MIVFMKHTDKAESGPPGEKLRFTCEMKISLVNEQRRQQNTKQMSSYPDQQIDAPCPRRCIAHTCSNTPSR